MRRPAASRSAGGSAPSASGSTATGTAAASRAPAAPSDWSTGVEEETDTGDGRDAFLEEDQAAAAQGGASRPATPVPPRSGAGRTPPRPRKKKRH